MLQPFHSLLPPSQCPNAENSSIDRFSVLDAFARLGREVDRRRWGVLSWLCHRLFSVFLVPSTYLFQKMGWTQLILTQIGEFGSHSRGSTSAASVNAFYAPLVNALFVPAGLLNPPFLRHDGLRSLGINFLHIAIYPDVFFWLFQTMDFLGVCCRCRLRCAGCTAWT